MAKALQIFKTIVNKIDDFIYFGIIALLIYYRTITVTDSLYYRTSLLILFVVIYIYICIKDKHNRLFTLLYYNKILFSILVIGIIILLDKLCYWRLSICFITLILPLFMGFKGNTNIINFKKQDKIFAYILSFLYLLVFIQSSYFIHINGYLDKYLFPYTITLIMVLITVYIVIKFIKHHTLKETVIYLISSMAVMFFGIFIRNVLADLIPTNNISNYAYFYVMIILWAGYIFFNIKFNEHIKPFRVILFIVFSIWLIYYPFSNHSQCYFASLDPQFYYIPEKGGERITTIHNPERIKELIPKICQGYNGYFNKRSRIWDYIQEKRKEDTDFPYDDSSYFFDTESKRYKELAAKLQKADIEKQEFLHKCETKYFDDMYSYIQGLGIKFWDKVDDKILVKEFSHKNEKGRISYEVYNFYEKDTGMLLYSGKTRTKFSSFIYDLGTETFYIIFPTIRTTDIYLSSYD